MIFKYFIPLKGLVYKNYRLFYNNTALKPSICIFSDGFCFGTIRNNTALKPTGVPEESLVGFGTIRNNTALKRLTDGYVFSLCFGTIRNNTALKPRGPIFLTKFRNRTIHLSQTSVSNRIPIILV